LLENKRETLSRRRRHFLKAGSAAAALTGLLSGAAPSYGQDAPTVSLAQAEPAPATPVAPGQPTQPSRERGELSTFVDSMIPGFQFNARVNLAETYATNASGSSAGGNQDDWLTMAGLNLDIHDHSRRVSIDAYYSGQLYYYSRSSTSTQFTNDLQAMATIIAIPDYLNFITRAFAQPVVLSNSGFSTANGIVNPNGYSNSYGYSLGPEVTFRLGGFASSDLLATYGGAYFQNPTGYRNILIPGVAGPEDITSRNVTETLKSGEDFSRLQWSLVGQLSETDRRQGLFSEKAGIGNLRYGITPEISLLGTGGYDSIHNTVPLSRDLSGPVALGGFELTFGPDFDLMAEAGRKYNGFSFLGSLRWNLSATAALTGLATDTVSTPEGQLLNNLSTMTPSLNGGLTTAGNIYSNGTTSSLASFSAQPLGSLSFTQTIARYQRVSITYSQDYERDHASLTLFGEKLTQLETIYIGPPTTTSWGGQAYYSHNITRDLLGSLGAGYSYYQELGGHSKNLNLSAGVDYTLGPRTNVYFRTDYFRREASQALQNLSPFTGSLDDIRLTIGLYRQL
jgi:uncharacterized protein (PEP-CTERM system associated)